MSVYDWLCMIIVFTVMILVTFVGKKEHRVKRFIIVVVLIPIILICLHGNCFFNQVPHCKACMITPEGEEPRNYPTDANELKSAGMFGYFMFVLIFTSRIVRNDVPKGKKSIMVGLTLLYIIFVAFPILAISYM